MDVRSVPKTLALPNKADYGVEELLLFDRLTRAIHKERYGQQAKPWNPLVRIQRWFDTSHLESGVASDAEVVYNYFDADARAVRQMKMTALQAATPNLPGLYDYPKFVVEPTTAYIENGVPGSALRSRLSPSILCTREQAEMLAAELKLKPEAITLNQLGGGPFRVVWGDEQRRSYSLLIQGMEQNAAVLLADRWRHGIGVPGEWSVKPTGAWFIPAVRNSGETDQRPEIPIPCRALYSQERVIGTFGNVPRIVRSDMEGPYNPAPVKITGAGLTEEQAATLSRIDTTTQETLRRMGGSPA